MTTATLNAPTTPRRPRTNPNNNRKAFDIAMRAWADTLIALRRAKSAGDTFSDALIALLPDEMDRIDGEDVRADLWHTLYALENQRSLLESSAPGSVYRLVADAAS